MTDPVWKHRDADIPHLIRAASLLFEMPLSEVPDRVTVTPIFDPDFSMEIPRRVKLTLKAP